MACIEVTCPPIPAKQDVASDQSIKSCMVPKRGGVCPIHSRLASSAASAPSRAKMGAGLFMRARDGAPNHDAAGDEHEVLDDKLPFHRQEEGVATLKGDLRMQDEHQERPGHLQ